MKTLLLILGFSLAIISCGSGKNGFINRTDLPSNKGDTIRISNESLEYEIIIVELGFDSWLVSQPPRGFYGQSYLETKNRMFVSDFNNRVLNPQRYPHDLYSERIDYDSTMDYGYEVNYLLYNYFMYFQQKYNQHLTGGKN